ncbi:MAG TPA: dihydrodipicolinate synthase family protein, partial [Blastocatellia bacterium]|nr:dihydrodipicolinate synthase family protein [Blastocatellia bacterium]
ADNVSRYNETGLSGYVALGSNGEAVHLSPDEREQVVETIKRAASADRAVIAGINEFSNGAALDAIRRAEGAGADAALVITPFFYKSLMTQDALLRYFTEVADSSGIPVLIYNVPQNTGVVIQPETIARLAEHDRILGVKDSSGDFGAIANTIRLAPPDFAVLTGNGSILYPSLAMGARGAILAVACAAPEAVVELYRAATSGDTARARELQTRIAPLSHAVTAGHGVPGLKAALDISGYAGGAPRPPLAEASEQVKAEIKGLMSRTGLFPQVD